jgi:hypothetical protein
LSESSKPREWTPEDWKNLANAVHPLLEEWIKYQKDRDEAVTKRMDMIGRHNRRLSSSLVVFLLIVVGGMSVLTYFGKVSGDALLFLAGTVTGYVIVMIQDLTAPIFDTLSADQT